MAARYILSISMSVVSANGLTTPPQVLLSDAKQYNKWMFSPGNLDFHYPLFTTACHMLVQFMLASLILFLFPRFRPQNGRIESPDPERDARPSIPTDAAKPLMTWWFYLTRIASCGTVTGLDIGLGNTSLKFISLTFFSKYQSRGRSRVQADASKPCVNRPLWVSSSVSQSYFAWKSHRGRWAASLPS